MFLAKKDGNPCVGAQLTGSMLDDGTLYSMNELTPVTIFALTRINFHNYEKEEVEYEGQSDSSATGNDEDDADDIIPLMATLSSPDVNGYIVDFRGIWF